MIRIKLEDGAVFMAQSYSDLVSGMKLDMYSVPDTKDEYKQGVARRSEIYDGQEISYNTDKEFILELQRIGVVVDLTETDKKICPRCGRIYERYGAISRRDNKTEICSECGKAEALEDFVEHYRKGDVE
jgi:predicted RNA-binding Zn-ribbon protein involved in translation (DUF1610 family)